MEDNKPYSTFAFNHKTNQYQVVYQAWPYTELGQRCAISACKEFVSQVEDDYTEQDWTFVAVKGDHIELVGDLV